MIIFENIIFNKLHENIRWLECANVTDVQWVHNSNFVADCSGEKPYASVSGQRLPRSPNMKVKDVIWIFAPSASTSIS